VSVELSRRVARLKMFEPIRRLPPATFRAFANSLHAAATFEDLPPAFQEMIIQAEAARDAYRVEFQAGRVVPHPAGAVPAAPSE
jgi:hypothetical protein